MQIGEREDQKFASPGRMWFGTVAITSSTLSTVELIIKSSPEGMVCDLAVRLAVDLPSICHRFVSDKTMFGFEVHDSPFEPEIHDSHFTTSPGV
jgi:hypothetical protein